MLSPYRRMDDGKAIALLTGLREQCPHGWGWLGLPPGDLSLSDISNILLKNSDSSPFILDVRNQLLQGWQPAVMEDKAAEFIMLMILTTVLSATEIAYSEAVDKTADFLIGVPNAWRLAFAIFSLTINAEFARTFNGSLYRDEAIKAARRMSTLPQHIIRDLWRRRVPEAVKISRGSRGSGKQKKSVAVEKKSVAPKMYPIARISEQNFVYFAVRLFIFHCC